MTSGVPSTTAWRRVALLLAAVGWGANHFAPLLAVYRAELHLDAAAPGLLLGVYALGLVPGLLVAGPLSDRRGRRAVVLPAALAALIASAVLGLVGTASGALLGHPLLADPGDRFVAVLVGRFLYGLAAGAVMSPGAVWVIELSRAARVAGADAAAAAGPRRATIALSAGFGLGPLVSGLLAQYAPAPTLTPYVVHLGVLALALIAAWTAPVAITPAPAATAATAPLLRFDLPPASWRHFLRGVALMAPFVFAFPAIAFAGIPPLRAAPLSASPIAFTGALTALTLLTGVLIQTPTRRLTPITAARLGLILGAAGLALGAATLDLATPLGVLGAGILLGAGYGTTMTAGLRALEPLAPPHARGALTGLYYVLTYVGFAAPYLIALAARTLPGATALLIVAAAAIVVAVLLRGPPTAER
jgi:hypothetical protein